MAGGRVLTIDGFHPGARALRSHFEKRFEDPRQADGGRFVWDWWHVPGQYTALRTPAYHFFPANAYRALHERLVLWGRENLGCHDISPPWLSCYVDGCRQELHGDLPHGPFAFVYSLTPWEQRKFTGGETLLLKPEILDFWKGQDARARLGMEEPDVLQTVAPKFNRLTVFDPRVPHGVRRVEGVLDPREGRLVVHGWFVQPRPFIRGSLPRAALSRAVDGVLGGLPGNAGDALDRVRGVLSLRFTVGASGTAGAAKVLADTLVAVDGDPAAAARVRGALLKGLKGLSFGRQRAASAVTLPVVFESQG